MLGPSQVHPSSVVDAGAELGAGVRIWHFCHVSRDARIGEGTSLGQGCYVGPGVTIGARVRVQNHVSLFEGVTVEDDVFIGPSVTFCNVRAPRAEWDRRSDVERTYVRRGATLGANATLLPGVDVGRYAFVGAGAVVTGDVRDHALVVGVPAREAGWMSRAGARLELDAAGHATCPVERLSYRVGERGLTCTDEA